MAFHQWNGASSIRKFTDEERAELREQFDTVSVISISFLVLANLHVECTAFVCRVAGEKIRYEASGWHLLTHQTDDMPLLSCQCPA